MATEDQLASIPSMTKRPISRKTRILTHSPTIGNNNTSRLPTLLSKSSVLLSTSGRCSFETLFFIYHSISRIETTYFKRRRPQQKDTFNTSSKIERQTRLPPLNSNDHNHKQRSDFQRRQVRFFFPPISFSSTTSY